MKFEDFSLTEDTLHAVSDMGFEEPTPIQEMAIPHALRGKDIIGQAQTGTGKTAAFGIPIVDASTKGRTPFAVILEPTRELAVQVAEEINRIGKYKRVSVLPIYGGQSIDRQIRALKKGVDVVVGTPGRVIDHIKRKTLSLGGIKTLVLDEADEMLDMGFISDMEEILKETPEIRQTMLFSATMPAEILRISKRYMNKPEKVAVNVADIIVPKIRQLFYEVKEQDKINALSRLIDVEDPHLALVFCHTKREVDAVSTKLQQMGYEAGALHGDFTQTHRDDMIGKFKKGVIDILVATDVAARGLDIKNVSHVINYSIPQNPEGYIHRIGRTARAGKSGMAITFVTPREYRQLRLIEKMAKTTISKGKLPTEKDVRKARERAAVEDLGVTIKSGEHSDYLSMVRGLIQEYDPIDLAAAAMSIAFGDLKAQAIEEQDFSKSKTESGMVRLFMTIGKKDKITAGDIVKSIASEADIPGRRIGKIAVYDTFTFVEVPEELADRVVKSIDDFILKGRRVRVEPAKPRK